MNKNCIQLEMNFDGSAENIFRRRCDDGVFQVLAEVRLPAADTTIADAAAKASDLEYLVLSRKEPAALAFIDENAPASGTVDPVGFLTALCKSSRDSHVLYLSGRGRSPGRSVRIAGAAGMEGFKNFCVVSGSPVPGENANGTRKRYFGESVPALDRLRSVFGNKIFCGCTVNPYKYTPADLCMQYSKLSKKINFGANFAVAQYGWDMLKLQELRWNLSARSLHIPTFARLLFLTPERAEDICLKKVPGVSISPDLEELLKREMKYSRAQFEAAQLRRFQIHASGARLLGYSGIQIAGVESPRRLETLLDRVAGALHEFQDFEHWKCAYREYYERLDMAPYPFRFYFYENLLSAAAPPDEPVIRNAEIGEPSLGEKIRFHLGRRLFSRADELPPEEKRLTKKLLFSCRSCTKCRLPQTFYLCPETCPLGLANGPCGASMPDGSCRFPERGECVFLRQMRMVNSLRDYPDLEETLIPSGRIPPDDD